MPKKKKHTLIDKLSERFHILLVNEKTLEKKKLFSSSSVRECLRKGDLKAAKKILGDYWVVKGEVIKADKSTKEERLAICEGCIHYHTPDDRCKICGCLMKVKASLAVESCPVNKW